MASALKEIAARLEDRPRLQDLVRQGQPHQRQQRARHRASTRRCRSSPRSARRCGVPVLTDVHEIEQCARVGAGGRRAADPGVPVPADRSAGRRREDRQGRQRQEGPVPRAVGHEERGRQDHRRRQPQRAGDRARRVVRLQHARLRHARAADPGARHRRAGDLRRHPFGAAAGRAGHLVGRRARVRAGAGARRGRGRRRRRVHRDASGSGQGAVRRAEHGAAQGHGRTAAHG